jgi:biopolymer transport protein TolR
MAVKVTGNHGPSKEVPTALAEINVTPFVDVMLVLLIIFMVTAPLLQQGIPVDLPKVDGTALRDAPGQVNLVLGRDQEIHLDDQRIEPAELGARLTALAAARPDVMLYVRADAALNYGFVAGILADVRKSRILNVGLVTEAPREPERR